MPLLRTTDLNVVQTNASYQLEGLRAFAAQGVPVQFIELGNELFDVYQGDAPPPRHAPPPQIIISDTDFSPDKFSFG